MLTTLDIDSFNKRAQDSIEPAWIAKNFSGEDLVDWTKKAWENRVGDLEELRGYQRDNIARYMGQYTSYGRFGSVTDGSLPKASPSKTGGRVNINMTRRLVEMSVAKVNKMNLESEAIPDSWDDNTDRQAASAANKILSHYRHLRSFPSLKARIIRAARLVGEGYAFVGWNPELGPEKGKPEKRLVKDLDGKSVTLYHQPRIGDIDIKTIHRENIVFLLAPGPDAPVAYACIIREFKHYLELRAEHPNVPDHLLRPGTCETWSDEALDYQLLTGYIPVYHVYVRSLPWCPEGAYWVTTPDAVLQEPKANPIPITGVLECSELGNLPVERMTDIEVDGNFHAISSLSDINLLQSQYDKLTSLIFRNIWLFAHPKWVVPRSGVNLEQLASGALVLQASGPFPPQLATYQVVTQDVFALWRDMPRIMGEQMAVFQHSFGEAPKGARSASQLMIYDEQEEEARAPFKNKLESFILSLEGKVLAVAAENLKTSEKRTISVLGDNMTWKTEEFDISLLKKEQTLRLKIPDGVPENKYARMQFYAQLRQSAPTVFSEEQFLNGVGYGQQERFLDYAQRAVLSAQAENELFMAGKDVPEPESYEDHIAHWREHANLLQSRAFKALSMKDKKPALLHIKAHESEMQEKAQENPAFAAVLTTLTGYPLVYKLPTPMVGLEQGMGQQMGAAPAPQPLPPMEMGNATQGG